MKLVSDVFSMEGTMLVVILFPLSSLPVENTAWAPTWQRLNSIRSRATQEVLLITGANLFPIFPFSPQLIKEKEEKKVLIKDSDKKMSVLFWDKQNTATLILKAEKSGGVKFAFNPELHLQIALNLQVFKGSLESVDTNSLEGYSPQNSCTKTLKSLSWQMPVYPTGVFHFCEWGPRRFVVWIIL